MGHSAAHIVNRAAGAAMSPLTASFAALGGLEAHGLPGAKAGAEGVVKDPGAYFGSPQGRGQFAAGVGTAAAFAGGAAAAGGLTTGTGELVGFSEGSAIEGQGLSLLGASLGGAGAIGAAGAATGIMHAKTGAPGPDDIPGSPTTAQANGNYGSAVNSQYAQQLGRRMAISAGNTLFVRPEPETYIGGQRGRQRLSLIGS